jgi:hypothetical protein
MEDSTELKIMDAVSWTRSAWSSRSHEEKLERIGACSGQISKKRMKIQKFAAELSFIGRRPKKKEIVLFNAQLLRLLLILHTPVYFLAQRGIDTIAIKKELSYILDRDQRARKTDSAVFARYIDSTNLVNVERIISFFGWPGKSVVGARGNYAAWLVIQHAKLKTQEKYLPMMRASVEKNESEADELAYLEDRILMRQGKDQIYGTQVIINQKTGAQEIWPIRDEATLDERRKKLGMESMTDYAKHFGIEYPPKRKLD